MTDAPIKNGSLWFHADGGEYAVLNLGEMKSAGGAWISSVTYARWPQFEPIYTRSLDDFRQRFTPYGATWPDIDPHLP